MTAKWLVYLRGRRYLRPRRYASLRRMLQESPVLLRTPIWRTWLVSGLMRVDGIPVELDLTYVLPDGVEIAVITERAVKITTFQSDLGNLVWNSAAARAGVGLALARELAGGQIDEFEARQQQEQQARLRWQSGDSREATTLRIDGRDVPAIRLVRQDFVALGADLGHVRVAVLGPASALAACELTVEPPRRRNAAGRRSG